MSEATETRRIVHKSKSPDGELITCSEVITSRNDGRLTMYGAEYYVGIRLEHSISGDYNRARATARLNAHWEGFASNHGALVPCGKETVIETENVNGKKVTAVIKWIHPTAKARNSVWTQLLTIARKVVGDDVRECGRDNGCKLIHSIDSEGVLVDNDGRIDPTSGGNHFVRGNLSTSGILGDIEGSLWNANKSTEAWYDIDGRSYCREAFVEDSLEPFDTPDDPTLTVAYVEITVEKGN